ncbi:hypothetical protein [Streptomyces sp. Ac-502]|uniref:hypothetical protein n=1 Tax=Streptomyces sp. Ac-502 TaxID=3342801 RepID=UPI0038693924
MNERPGPDGTPADERRLPREPLARLREPAVPRQNRRAGAHDSGENGEHGGHTGCAVRLGHHERHGLEDCHGLGATRVVTVYGDDETDAEIDDEIDAEPPAGGAHENAAGQSPAPEGTDPMRAPVQDRLEHEDRLEHQDPAVAADAAGAESLLRCWIRESGTPRPTGNRLRLLSTPARQLCTYPSCTGRRPAGTVSAHPPWKAHPPTPHPWTP